MNDVDVLRTIGRAPMRTMRTQDLQALVANPTRTIARLIAGGALTKLAHGIYTAPPDGSDGRRWKPSLEDGALALATARFGPRSAILMGEGAARHWHAIPRAVATTTVAVGERGLRPVDLATGGRIRFAYRRLEDVDAVLERTMLGEALVTTPAQTLFDLVNRRELQDTLGAAQLGEAIDDLVERVRAPQFMAVLTRSRRVPRAARDLLPRLGA